MSVSKAANISSHLNWIYANSSAQQVVWKKGEHLVLDSLEYAYAHLENFFGSSKLRTEIKNWIDIFTKYSEGQPIGESNASMLRNATKRWIWTDLPEVLKEHERKILVQKLVTPTLDSILVRGQYMIPDEKLAKLPSMLRTFDRDWSGARHGNAFRLNFDFSSYVPKGTEKSQKWFAGLKQLRPEIPVEISLVVVEKKDGKSVVDVECRPCLFYRITALHEREYPEEDIQAAQIRCKRFAQEIMGGLLEGIEVLPLSIYPSIRRTEIRSRLLNFGLLEIVECLDIAEKHIVQRNWIESLTRSRTAFEKIIEYYIEKHNLEKTDQTSKNIERLRVEGFLGNDAADLFRACYRFLSNVGTHEKSAKPDLYEAQLGHGYALLSLEYILNNL